MSRLMGRSLAVLSSIVLAASVASAAPRVAAVPDEAPPRVAIVPGIAVNLDTARVDALSQDLAEALNAELVVEAVGGLEVRRLLPAEGLPPDCVTTPACTAEVGKRTKATQLLFVVMVDSGAGGTIQVDTTWVVPGTNQTASRPAIDLTSASEARGKFATAARSLLPEAKVREKPMGGGANTTMSEGTPRHFTTPALLAAGVGIAGVGAGVALFVSTRSKFLACEADIVGCNKEKRDAIRSRAFLADTAFVIGAVGIGAAVVLYMTSAREPQLIVEPTPEGAAVSWAGRF